MIIYYLFCRKFLGIYVQNHNQFVFKVRKIIFIIEPNFKLMIYLRLLFLLNVTKYIDKKV